MLFTMEGYPTGLGTRPGRTESTQKSTRSSVRHWCWWSLPLQFDVQLCATLGHATLPHSGRCRPGTIESHLTGRADHLSLALLLHFRPMAVKSNISPVELPHAPDSPLRPPSTQWKGFNRFFLLLHRRRPEKALSGARDWWSQPGKNVRSIDKKSPYETIFHKVQRIELMKNDPFVDMNYQEKKEKTISRFHSRKRDRISKNRPKREQ